MAQSIKPERMRTGQISLPETIHPNHSKYDFRRLLESFLRHSGCSGPDWPRGSQRSQSTIDQLEWAKQPEWQEIKPRQQIKRGKWRKWAQATRKFTGLELKREKSICILIPLQSIAEKKEKAASEIFYHDHFIPGFSMGNPLSLPEELVLEGYHQAKIGNWQH